MQRGEVYNRERAAQIRDFSGLRFGNITPTDIDGLIEYKDKCYIFIEAKVDGEELPHGQELALTRLADNLVKPALVVVAAHTHPTHEDIDMGNAIVQRYYWNKGWWRPTTVVSVQKVLDSFIKRFGK